MKQISLLAATTPSNPPALPAHGLGEDGEDDNVWVMCGSRVRHGIYVAKRLPTNPFGQRCAGRRTIFAGQTKAVRAMSRVEKYSCGKKSASNS